MKNFLSRGEIADYVSSVDEKTEAIMQDIIDDHFRDRTVISVMHRFRFINRYDKVALMRSGRLIEFDEPKALLSRDSAFSELYRAQYDRHQL
jgi:ATP-binding cassette, subfamily C (CFTR/MRP), member 1